MDALDQKNLKIIIAGIASLLACAAAVAWLFVRRRRRHAPWPAVCIDCGCTEDRPCVGADGQRCGWAFIDPELGEGVCTRCEQRREAARAR